MAYLDDKMEQIESDKLTQYDTVARATFAQLSNRFGCTAVLHFPAPAWIEVKTMDFKMERWELDGEQPGVTWQKKIYRRVS